MTSHSKFIFDITLDAIEEGQSLVYLVACTLTLLANIVDHHKELLKFCFVPSLLGMSR